MTVQKVFEIMNRQLMSRKAVADFFRISLPTVNEWTKKGLLPKPVYIGIHPYWEKEAVETSFVLE